MSTGMQPLEMTCDDHVRLGRLADQPHIFFVQLGDLRRSPGTPFDEAVAAARNISEKCQGRTVRLALSGGVDSHAMLLAFAEAGVSFDAIFLRFKNDLNLFDIETNVAVCEAMGINHSFIDLDVIHFFESGLYAGIADEHECQSPQLAVHLWMLDRIFELDPNCIPILGGNPVAPIRKDDRWLFIGLPGELHAVYFRYFLNRQKIGVPFFFLYSPELIASFFRLPSMKNFVEGRVSSEGDYTYYLKVLNYREGGFDVVPRDDKFTGFEKVRAYYDRLHGTNHGVAFNRLYRTPLEERFPFPQAYYQLVPRSYFP